MENDQLTQTIKSQQSPNSAPQQEESSLQLRDIWYICISHWKWFVLTTAVCLFLATIYYLKQTPVYSRSAEVLIKSDNRGRSVSRDIQSFSDIGMYETSAKVYNELHAFQSNDYMQEVVRRLHLQTDYYVDGHFHNHLLYGRNLPVHVYLNDLTETETASLTIELGKQRCVILSDFVRNGKRKGGRNEKCKGLIGDTLNTPLGQIVVQPTLDYTGKTSEPIHVKHSNLYSATRRYAGKLSASLADKQQSEVIRLSVSDISTQRAEDLITTLITVYNEYWVEDNNQIANSTSQFINERLALIEQELAGVDNDISSYKSSNMLPDVHAAANLYMNQSSTMSAQLLSLNNQLSMTRYIQDWITDENNKNSLIPQNTGIGSATVESQIREYNELMLERNNQVAHSSAQSSLVIAKDRTLATMRQSIISSVNNQIYALNTQINNLRRSEQQTNARIAANPNQAKTLLSVERQQTVKESLYLYLLKKREENELSQAFTAYNTRVMESPTGSPAPTAPNKKRIMLVALIIGIGLPAAFFILRELLVTTVRGRKDLEKITTPFLGEIPQAFAEPHKINFLGKTYTFGRKSVERRTVVVGEGKRDMSNEAFRVLRTNLEFVCNSSDECKTLLLASFNSGSGKTFITINLGISLALKGKKVLLIDGDLRHASLSTYVSSPKHGFSHFLGRQVESVNDVIVADPKQENLYVLPVGKIQPNPTELIGSDLLPKMMDDLKKQFDYIIFDCPPIDIVADTQIIETVVDRTLFVVRAGLLERSMLGELDNLYKQGKFKNMAIILNGTTDDGGRYGYKYGYQYGYRYGYKYGYRYGYHYHTNESPEENIVR